MKRLLGIIFIAGLVVPVLAQRGEPKLSTQDAPSLRILSAPLKADRAKRRVKLWLEIKNAGDKTIRAFKYEYRAKGVIQAYDVKSTAELPEVSVVLPPGARKKLLLVDDSSAPGAFFDLTDREIRIIGVTFQDGSAWERNKDDYSNQD